MDRVVVVLLLLSARRVFSGAILIRAGLVIHNTCSALIYRTNMFIPVVFKAFGLDWDVARSTLASYLL